MRYDAQAMAECRTILEQSKSSFGTAIRLLPPQSRGAMTAYYAFCRVVDDAVDSAPDTRTAARLLFDWHRRLDDIYAGTARDSLDRALMWAVRKFSIRKEHLAFVIEGCEYDLDRQRFDTFADLYEYCYRVASAVGLVVTAILGADQKKSENYAEFTGIAVQLTNILRDVGEDADRGRIYLPREDMDAFGVSEHDITGRRMTEQLKNLLQFEAMRNHEFYRIAGAALPQSERRRLYFAEAVRETYGRLLTLLEQEQFPVFEKKVKLTKSEKIFIALKHKFI